MLEVLTIQPAQPAVLTVIWLHGLGADGHDFEPIVPHLGIPDQYPVRFIFPHAPVRSVTVNMGMQMRAWYDIINPVIGVGMEDRTGIRESCEQVGVLIEHELSAGMRSDQIVLAGFSQGGAIALSAGLCYPKRLSGILALSTYLPLADTFRTERHPINQETPILYLHGSFDPVIALAVADVSREHLRGLEYHVESKDYPIPHSVSAEEIADIGHWLTQRCETAAG